MKLIVGLGNVGKEYNNTRHNIGFMAIDILAEHFNVIFQNKLNGYYGSFIYKGEKVILLKPAKFMNLSGEVIQSYMHYFKINVEDIFIIHDDLDIPIGNIKLKCQGSSGGHNGLKNIEVNVGTNKYKRLKVGISNTNKNDATSYVLSKLSKEECKAIDNIMEKIPDIITDFLSISFENVMNKYNGK